MKRIKGFLLIATLCSLTIGAVVLYRQNKKGNISETEKRLDSMFILDTLKGEYSVMVTEDEIWLNEFTNIVNEMGHFTITKSDYPELYRQGVANSSFISVVTSEDKSKIVISNNQPDHGAYSFKYKLIFDPITKEITEVPRIKTEINEYKQVEIPKQSKEGSCWTFSIASSNSRAWRCMTENYIYDPCFETDTGQVVCAIDSGIEEPFELKLTEPLPKQRNSDTREASYWLMELENGLKCYVYTGTADIVNNELVYHYCPPYSYLLSGIKNGEGGENKTIDKNGEYWTVRMVVDPYDEPSDKILPVEVINVVRVWE